MPCTTETNKAVERRFVEEFWNENKLDNAEEFYAADYRRHDPNTPGVASGPEGVRQVAAMLRAAFLMYDLKSKTCWPKAIWSPRAGRPLPRIWANTRGSRPRANGFQWAVFPSLVLPTAKSRTNG